ncbi:MAG: DUF488 family protein [Actinomycetia bacterium]|nr:DUF488 family protein [Actinomycetes bacterium]
MSTPQIDVKRVYDDRADSDGTRILVDRMWPRGMRKDAADLDDWNKDVAPSSELRRWYGHDPDRFEEFSTRYRDELDERSAELDALLDGARDNTVTLLTATKDVEHSHAVVLADVLRAR